MRNNRGAAGIDGQTIAEVEAYGVDRVYIPKADGKSQRPLGIPRVQDRILQAAARLVLEPIFVASFKACSYGFRPKRSAHQAVEAVSRQIWAGEH